MKLEELLYFAKTHDVRAVARGKDPGTKSTTYYLVIDQYTTPFAEDVERFEHEHNAAGLQMLPFRNYHGQGTEIWREAKLSPSNIQEELVAFAKQHPEITEVRKGNGITWHLLSPLRTYQKKFFTIVPQLADVSRSLSRRGAHIDINYGTIYSGTQGTRVWKRKKSA